jgi:hypothetical protein
MTAPEVIKEIFARGGKLWLEIGKTEEVCIRVGRQDAWLIEEARKVKPQVLRELKRRWLTNAEPHWRM